MKVPLWCCGLLPLLCAAAVSSKKVLIISLPMVSHMNEMNEVGLELIKMGHTVYQVVPAGYEDLHKIHPDVIKPIFFHVDPEDEVSSAEQAKFLKGKSMAQVIPVLSKKMYKQCSKLMRDDFLQQLKDIGFDLMIIDGLGLVQCRYIVPYHLRIPFVYQFSAHMEWNMGLPVLPSITPAFTGIDTGWNVTDKMSFWERIVNLFMMIVDYVLMPLPFLTDNTLLYEYSPNVSSWSELMRKSDLFLVTRDHMLEWPMVQFPNVITSPGITLRPVKMLPDDLEALFSGPRAAEHGVVIVSFGSTSGDLEDMTMDELFKGLGQIQQTVVMRFVGDDIEAARRHAPANLHLLTWMPQFDMLGHNNTVGFVTHCGNNGQYEALYTGVPMLGLPMFAEQHHNAFRAVAHGYGLKIDDINTMTAEDLSTALKELIGNPVYRQKVQHASQILKADPMLPKEKLAYWVDHVMQYGGAHLRPAAMDMSLCSVFMLDIMAFFVVMFVLMGYLIRRCCCEKCVKRSNKPKQE